MSASEKYRDEVGNLFRPKPLQVWTRCLRFLLNTSDIFLAEQILPGQLGSELSGRIVDSLFSTWLEAIAQEQIQSRSYWTTLTQLTRRWRHHVWLLDLQ